MKGKGLLKSFFSLGAVQVANYALPLLSVPIISRIIGPDHYGTINFCTSFVSYFVLLINYGFDLSATRKLAQNQNDTHNRNRVTSEVLCCKALLFLGSLLLFVIFLFTIPQLEDEKNVASFTFLSCISAVITPNWIFQAMQNLTKFALLNFTTKVIYTISILFLIKETDDYYWQPIIYNIVQLVTTVIAFFWAFNRYQIRIKLLTLRECFVLLKEGNKLFISMVVVGLYTNTSVVILGLVRSAVEVGYFTAAQRLIDIVQVVIVLSISQVLYPFISKAFGESKENGISIIQKLLPLISLSTLLIGLCAIITGPFILRIFYGNAFESSNIIFQLLSFLPFINILNNILGVQTMLNLNMEKLYFKITVYGSIMGLVLNIVMIKVWGDLGAALNMLLVQSVIMLTLNYFLKFNDINIFRFEYFKYNSIKGYLKPKFGRL